MLDLSSLDLSVEIGFFFDASATKELGFGAILQNKWIQRMWNPDFIESCSPSIKYLALYALCVGGLTLQDEPKLRNAWVYLHCDNVVVIHMINNMSSSCKNSMFLLRILTHNGLKYNCRLTAKYINTKLNDLLDTLSPFRELGSYINQFPSNINQEL